MSLPTARSALDPHWRLIRRLVQEAHQALGLAELWVGVPATWVPEGDPLFQPLPALLARFASSENLARLRQGEMVQGRGLAGGGDRAFLALPLRYPGEAWQGLLLVLRDTPFTAEEAWQLTQVAEEVALVLSHWGWRYAPEASREPEAWLAAFGELAAALQQATSAQEAMEQTCRIVRRWLKAASASVLLPDEEGNLVLAASAGIDPAYLQKARLPAGQGVGGDVLRTGRPALVRDTRQDPRFLPVFPQHRSMVVVPIGFGEHRIGTLSADSTRTDAFDEQDVHRLTLAATLLGGFLLQHDLRRRLRQAEQQLHNQEARYSEALDNLLHEIGGPITYLLGYLDLLREHPALRAQPEVLQYLEVMTRKARELQQFIQRMRTSLYFTPEPQPLDLRDVVNQTLSLMRPEAQKKSLRLELEVADALPLVYADPVGVAQVLENLLSNAIRYSPPGGTVRLLLEPLPDVLQVRVIDQGPGIPPEVQERIFERFFRWYPEQGPGRRSPAGMGVGLALAREIIQAHGGRIWVDSQPGQGATFAFTLPYYRPPVQEEHP